MDQVTSGGLGSLETKFDEQTLIGLTGGRPGSTDVPCPICGPHARSPLNQRRKVLRIWDNQGFLTYRCARCGAQGVATGDKPRPYTQIKPQDDSARRALADRLWGMSYPVGQTFTETEAYLRYRKCWLPCSSIHHLPIRKGYPPTMIAKFQGVSAVHVTRLRPDGLGKAGTDHDKLIKGPCSGYPIVIQSKEWSKPLIICEGIEDGLSLALACPNWTVWAAGSAGHVHKLVKVAEKQVIVVVDDDNKTKHVNAGKTAAERCLAINPQTKIIMFQKGLDPNAILVQYGLNELRRRLSCHQPFHR